jgi:hypothetical protein
MLIGRRIAVKRQPTFSPLLLAADLENFFGAMLPLCVKAPCPLSRRFAQAAGTSADRGQCQQRGDTGQ